MNPPDWTALAFLIICFACGVGMAGWRLFGPGRYTLLERFLYAPCYVVARILWRVQVAWSPEYGAGSKPEQWQADWLLSDRMQGGGVLVANHCSSMDPFFVQLCAGRRVHWMVASEYFRAPVVGSLLRAFEAIPTHRGGVDTASTKQAMAFARQGRFVGMFPEGRINRTGQPLMTVRPGAALVALRARVPIVPIWIEGAPIGPSIFSALFRAANIRVFVGPPDDWGLREAASSDRADRSIAEEWIARVMLSSVARSGRTVQEVSLAGRHWVKESE
jgi:1-acyl-sn-glycerol-3-phosphate acyltransferase